MKLRFQTFRWLLCWLLRLNAGARPALVLALIVLAPPSAHASTNDARAAGQAESRHGRGAPVLLALAHAASPSADSAAVELTARQASTVNPYGIASVWKGSDIVARFVLALLVIMSGGSWYILVAKSLEHSRMSRHAKTAARSFWTAQTVSAGASALEPDSAFRFIAESGVAANHHHEGLRSHIPMNDWIPMSISAAVDRVQANTQRGLAFPATVGATSPFVGLFGTVWGIYDALTAIGISGQASIDKVAGPVGEALIMTRTAGLIFSVGLVPMMIFRRAASDRVRLQVAGYPAAANNPDGINLLNGLGFGPLVARQTDKVGRGRYYVFPNLPEHHPREEVLAFLAALAPQIRGTLT